MHIVCITCSFLTSSFPTSGNLRNSSQAPVGCLLQSISQETLLPRCKHSANGWLFEYLPLEICSLSDIQEAANFMFPSKWAFLPTSLRFLGRLHCHVFCLLLPLDAHEGSLASDAIFIIYKKVDSLSFSGQRKSPGWV